MQNSVYIIEDNPEVARVIKRILKRKNFDTFIFKTGLKALEEIKYSKPDLILLDLILPDIDGIEICKLLKTSKKTKHIPLIMITARNTDKEIVKGLKLGADDYITKPFSNEELLARVEALMRRIKYHGDPEKTIKCGKFQLNKTRRILKIKNKKVKLTAKEFDIIEILMRNAGKIVEKDKLIDLAWNYNENIGYKTLEVHICRIKKKVNKEKQYIENIYGIGYRFNSHP
ncbi:MAG: response regulator transcription factor [Elusimicrobiota bacterium]